MPRKAGSYSISWMRFPVNIFDSMEAKAVQLEYGFEALGIYAKLLCVISSSKNGYFMDFSEDSMKVFALTNSIKFDTLKRILDTLLDKGMFEKEIYEAYSVLTNVSIQETFANYCRKRHPVKVNAEFWILTECHNVEIVFENTPEKPANKEKIAKDQVVKAAVNNINDAGNAITGNINTPEEKRREEKIIEEKREGRKKFKPPTIGEIKKECEVKGYLESYPDLHEKFFLHYESKGWFVGKNKMKSWKAALAGWVVRNKDGQQRYVKDYTMAGAGERVTKEVSVHPTGWEHFIRSWKYLNMTLGSIYSEDKNRDGFCQMLIDFTGNISSEFRSKIFNSTWESNTKNKVDGPTYGKIVQNIERLLDSYEELKSENTKYLDAIKSGKFLKILKRENGQ
jgi:hypothetical protein